MAWKEVMLPNPLGSILLCLLKLPVVPCQSLEFLVYSSKLQPLSLSSCDLLHISSVSSNLYFSSQEHQPLTSGPTLGLHLKLITSANVLFPNWSRSQFPCIRTFWRTIEISSSPKGKRDNKEGCRENLLLIWLFIFFNDYAYVFIKRKWRHGLIKI